MKLFISHASEDKDDFVRPLAAALKEHYDVWYDEYELVVGDSLRQKIDAGLRACDFGVVVLSPSFFAKKWPQDELDGLFALETATRKMILPVWKEVSQADVKAFSPILAGRLATLACAGVPAVVADIRRSIDASVRTLQLSAVDSLKSRIRGVGQTMKDEREAAILMHSEQGVDLVKQDVEHIFSRLENLVTESNETNDLKFKARRTGAVARYREAGLVISTVDGLHLGLRFEGDAVNSAEKAKLIAVIYRVRTLSFGQEAEPVRIEEIRYKPLFNRGQTAWKLEDDDEVFLADEVATHALGRLIDQIEGNRGD